MVEEDGRKNWRTASEDEIASFVSKAAEAAKVTNGGFFYPSDVVPLLKEQKIKVKPEEVTRIARLHFQIDDLAPNEFRKENSPFPLNANLPVSPPEPGPDTRLTGMFDELGEGRFKPVK